MTDKSLPAPHLDWYEPAKASSQVSMIAYNEAHQLMGVRFHSTKDHEYLYHNVSPEQFRLFDNAESLGKHLGQHVKGKHAFTKVARPKEQS